MPITCEKWFLAVLSQLYAWQHNQKLHKTAAFWQQTLRLVTTNAVTQLLTSTFPRWRRSWRMLAGAVRHLEVVYLWSSSRAVKHQRCQGSRNKAMFAIFILFVARNIHWNLSLMHCYHYLCLLQGYVHLHNCQNWIISGVFRYLVATHGNNVSAKTRAIFVTFHG